MLVGESASVYSDSTNCARSLVFGVECGTIDKPGKRVTPREIALERHAIQRIVLPRRIGETLVSLRRRAFPIAAQHGNQVAGQLRFLLHDESRVAAAPARRSVARWQERQTVAARQTGWGPTCLPWQTPRDRPVVRFATGLQFLPPSCCSSIGSVQCCRIRRVMRPASPASRRSVPACPRHRSATRSSS